MSSVAAHDKLSELEEEILSRLHNSRITPMEEIVHDMKKQGVWDDEMEELAREAEG